MRIGLKKKSVSENGLLPSAEAPGSPYAAARGVFHDRYMKLARAVRNWQLTAFGFLALSIMLSVISLHLVRSERIIPYVVERDALGRTAYAGVIDPAALEQDEIMAAQIGVVVANLRTVYSDAVAQTDLINSAYRFVAPEAARFLSGYFATPENNPIALGERLIRRVDIESVLRVPESDSWNVTWRETTISRLDGRREDAAWQAFVTTAFKAPKEEVSARENPLGLYLTGINWSKVN